MTHSMAEIEKALREVFVDKELYERSLARIHNDFEKLEQNQNKMLWWIIGVMGVLLVQVVILVIQRGSI
jgi:hypothetical protein